MTVCSYYLRGACKYGDRCRNEHPGAPTSFSNQTWTSSNPRAVPYTVETIATDVTPYKDKPLWPLSSYGPSKHEPVVISGLDESPEELRLKAVTALKAGTTNEYIKYETERTTAAEQMYTNARSNIRQLYEQALKVSASAPAASPSVSTAMATAPAAFVPSAAVSAFGGATTPAFGKSAFGQPAFGQTSLGGSATGTSAFSQGTPSFAAPAQQVSAFSQPSQTTSAFGQAKTTSAFGQSTQPSSVFGQPSTFGGAAQPTSAFAQPSTQTTSVFGKPSQTIFGSSQPTLAFGQPSQPASAFVQPTSAFSQLSQSAFGQSSSIKPASGAFGGAGGGGFSAFTSQPSAFTSTAAPSSSITGTTPGQSAFGSAPPVQSVFGAVPSAPKSALGTSQPSPFGTSSPNNTLTVPSMSFSVSADGGGSPFASSPMTVTPSNEKPAVGAPDFANAKLVVRIKPGADSYLGLLPRDYNETIPADVKAAFASARFEWGKIPDWIPPEEVR